MSLEARITAFIAAVGADIKALFADKQDALVSGSNIKSVGGISLLGSGNVPVVTDSTFLLKESLAIGSIAFLTRTVTSTTPACVIGSILTGDNNQSTLRVMTATGALNYWTYIAIPAGQQWAILTFQTANLMLCLRVS